MGDTLTDAELINQLQNRIKQLERLNNKVGLRYKTEAEEGDAQKLISGCVPYLEPVPDLDVVKPDSTANPHVLIEGDNLTTLTMLQSTHAGKVNVIYIDPPYNTGNDDFVYNDRFVGTDDGFRHSKWLSFMKPRLELAKRLLADDGVIFVSIDDHEQAYLKVLMDEVFGEQNFVGSAPRKTRAFATTKGDSEMQTLADYILIYTKNRSKGVFQKRVVGEKTYPYEDERGKYYTVPLNDNGPHGYRAARPNLYYPIYEDGAGGVSSTPTSFDSVGILPPLKSGVDGCWMWSLKKFAEDRKDLVVKDSRVFIKHYYNPDEDQRKLQHEKLWIDNLLNTKGTKDLNSIFGKNSKLFSYPKPVDLMKWCVSLHPSKSALVLDFFAGSGTMGQAVAALNTEDGGSRQAILCTNQGEASMLQAERFRELVSELSESQLAKLTTLVAQAEQRNEKGLPLRSAAEKWGRTQIPYKVKGAELWGTKKGSLKQFYQRWAAICDWLEIENVVKPTDLAREVTAVRLRRVLLDDDWASKSEPAPLVGELRYYSVKFTEPLDSQDNQALREEFNARTYLSLIAIQTGVSALPVNQLPEQLASAAEDGFVAFGEGHNLVVMAFSDYHGFIVGGSLYAEALQYAQQLAESKRVALQVYITSDMLEVMTSEQKKVEPLSFPLPYVEAVKGVVSDFLKAGVLVKIDAKELADDSSV